jgi:orotate phosphoribosyltransferase-like protein
MGMDNVEKARHLQAQGNSIRQIAAELKVSKSTVGRWLLTPVEGSFLTPMMNDNCISRPTTIGFPGPTYAARPFNDD